MATSEYCEELRRRKVFYWRSPGKTGPSAAAATQSFCSMFNVRISIAMLVTLTMRIVCRNLIG